MNLIDYLPFIYEDIDIIQILTIVCLSIRVLTTFVRFPVNPYIRSTSFNHFLQSFNVLVFQCILSIK